MSDFDVLKLFIDRFPIFKITSWGDLKILNFTRNGALDNLAVFTFDNNGKCVDNYKHDLRLDVIGNAIKDIDPYDLYDILATGFSK